MATLYNLSNPPIKGSAYTFDVCLFDSDGAIQTDPTLAAGDIVIYKDGVLDGNIDTLPADIGSSGIIPVALSAAEMTANRVTVWFHDAADDEWADLLVTFATVQAVTVSGTEPLSAAQTAAAVLDAVAASYDDAGSIGEQINNAGASGDPWSAAVRTLTSTAAETLDAVEGSKLTIQRGDTFSATLTGLAANTSYVSIDFTVKNSPNDSDDNAILRIRKNASATGDGLLRLNGAALVSPVVAADGSITVNSATSLTITLAARATDDLVPADLYYDIQYIFASSVQTATEGAASISADITRAIA